jgi:hypothetical protein
MIVAQFVMMGLLIRYETLHMYNTGNTFCSQHTPSVRQLRIVFARPRIAFLHLIL